MLNILKVIKEWLRSKWEIETYSCVKMSENGKVLYEGPLDGMPKHLRKIWDDRWEQIHEEMRQYHA